MAVVKFATDKKIDAYIAAEKVEHNDAVAKAPHGRTPKDLTIKEKMAENLRTRKERRNCSKLKAVQPDYKKYMRFTQQSPGREGGIIDVVVPNHIVVERF